MIIPIKCFTCGKVLADKWMYFKAQSTAIDTETDTESMTVDDLKIDDSNRRENYFESNPKGKLLDKMGLTKICCRRHMLGHVDLIDII